MRQKVLVVILMPGSDLVLHFCIILIQSLASLHVLFVHHYSADATELPLLKDDGS